MLHQPDNWLAIRGLRPGDYSIRPFYRGGLEGHPTSVRVQPSLSTFAQLTLPPTGALSVTWDVEMCRPSSRASLVSVEPSSQENKTSIVRELIGFETPDDCRYYLEGLPAGPYVLRFEDLNDGLKLSRPFEAIADHSITLAIEAPRVNVTGHVVRGGRPIQGNVEIRLRKEDRQANDPGVPSVKVSPSGAFVLGVPSPGRYRASLVIDGVELVGVKRALTLVDGTNAFD